jgi:demethylmenaquinone methyltransferase / 2-methoxy-6-polyprenyl-1,4-benzoquinol methylase
MPGHLSFYNPFFALSIVLPSHSMTAFPHDNVVPFKDSALTKKEQVAAMFNDIAFRYDFLNRFLSAGIDVGWRKKALRELKSLQPGHILDVATGTADVALLAMKILKPEKVTGIDISDGMLDIGREKIAKAGLTDNIILLNGDSETINFPDHTFDAVTVAFGVRNFENLEKGLSEIKRVLKPGGKLVVLEFSKPRTTGFSKFYTFYMKIVTPGVGKLFSKNQTAYQYLDESIQKFPEGAAFIQILDKLGYQQTYCKSLSLGICSIYCGQK